MPYPLKRCIPLVDLRPGIEHHRSALQAAINEVLDTGAFVLGSAVGRFEADLAAYLDVPYAIGVASCSDALEFALRAVGVQPGDGVITTPFTFVATAEAIVNAGALPVFSDIDPDTWLLDCEQLSEQLKCFAIDARGLPVLPGGVRIAALLPVHLFGRMHNLAALASLQHHYGFAVVEDAAQALGGSFAGRKPGALTDAACLSFFPSKTLGAFGDAGAVVTQRKDVAFAVQAMRQHGYETRASVEPKWVGRNSRLDTIQAAILRTKLPCLDDEITKRRYLLHRYASGLSTVAPDLVAALCYQAGDEHAAQQMVVRAKHRDQLSDYLNRQGIATAVYYPKLISDCQLYSKYPCLGSLSHARKAASESLALPLYPDLSDSDVDYIVEVIRAFAPLGWTDRHGG